MLCCAATQRVSTSQHVCADSITNNTSSSNVLTHGSRNICPCANCTLDHQHNPPNQCACCAVLHTTSFHIQHACADLHVQGVTCFIPIPPVPPARTHSSCHPSSLHPYICNVHGCPGADPAMGTEHEPVGNRENKQLEQRNHGCCASCSAAAKHAFTEHMRVQLYTSLLKRHHIPPGDHSSCWLPRMWICCRYCVIKSRYVCRCRHIP